MTDTEHTAHLEEAPGTQTETRSFLPDGIGLSLEQVQRMLVKTHKIVVDDHDPILMAATILNAHLTEVDKLQVRHKEGLTRLMAGKTGTYASGVQAAVGRLTDSLSSASVEGIRKIFDEHAARPKLFKSNITWLAAIMTVSALPNMAVFVLGGLR